MLEQLAGVGLDRGAVAVGDVVALLLEPGEQVEVGPEEPVLGGARLRQRAVERDLDRAAGPRDGVAAERPEVQRLTAEGVVGLVGGGGEDVEQLRGGGAVVVAHDEHDLVLLGPDRERDEVDARRGQRRRWDRVGRLPVAAVDLAGGGIHRAARVVVVDRRRARVHQAAAGAAVVAHPVDRDVDGLRREGRGVAADLQDGALADVDARLGGEAAEVGVVVRDLPRRRPGPLAVVLVDDRVGVGAADGGARARRLHGGGRRQQDDQKGRDAVSEWNGHA